MSVPVDPLSREDGFEHQDANVRRLVIVGLGIFATLLLSALGVAGLLGWYNAQPQVAVTPLERQRIIPPAPRLEASPRGNANAQLQDAQQRLAGYGWIDRANGVARIPLSRARAVLLERGWPNPTEPVGTVDPRLQQTRDRGSE